MLKQNFRRSSIRDQAIARTVVLSVSSVWSWQNVIVRRPRREVGAADVLEGEVNAVEIGQR